MSRSVFLGRELTERTTYIRNEVGDLLEAITVRESPWTDDDRGWALALLAEEADCCQGCGQPRSVCMDPATRQTWTVARHTCEACRALEVELQNDSENPTRHRGRKYAVIRS